MNHRRTSVAALAMLAVALAAAACGGGEASPTPGTTIRVNPSFLTPTATRVPPPPCELRAPRKQYGSVPAMMLDPEKKYFATIETQVGDFRVELFADKAPVTVNNFVFLSNEGFYDCITFHRVLPNFMAQTGDPTGTGGGGPGYQFADEFDDDLTHKIGAVSMANAGPGTNGSQFFIVFQPQDGLNGRHSVFGQVVSGMDVVLKIRLRDPDQGGPPGDVLKRIIIDEV